MNGNSICTGLVVGGPELKQCSKILLGSVRLSDHATAAVLRTTNSAHDLVYELIIFSSPG